MSKFEKITEKDSLYNNLESKSIQQLLTDINEEDKKIAFAVEKVLPQVEKLVYRVIQQLEQGGRLFYLGAGTSGRMGILDASECPPTFGVPHSLVTGLIAGGNKAILKAVENAEDDTLQAWKTLREDYAVTPRDFVIGIAASGTTPYVIGGLEKCQENHIPTGCITSNPGSPIVEVADFPIEVVVGPEYVTGSSRMKSGTAQKMILNMISTATLIRLGRVKDNKMVDMQLSNAKLVERGTKLIEQETQLPAPQARELLIKYGSVRKALLHYGKGKQL